MGDWRGEGSKGAHPEGETKEMLTRQAAILIGSISMLLRREGVPPPAISAVFRAKDGGREDQCDSELTVLTLERSSALSDSLYALPLANCTSPSSSECVFQGP